MLLDAAPAIAAYVPVDISAEMLLQEAAELAARLSAPDRAAGRGRLHQAVPAAARDRGAAARRLLPGLDHRQFRAARGRGVPAATPPSMLGAGATLIIGVDLVKDAGVLNAAYNDAAGVTARFNLNLLDAHQPRARRQFRPRRASAPRVLQSRAAPHRDASREPQAPEGAGGRALRSNSAPAKPSTPRTATSTRRNPSARWRAARAGRRWRRGPIRRAISRCRR